MAHGPFEASVLAAIQQGATYGYRIHRALGDQGFDIRLNHLYPVLKRLEAEGLVASSEAPGERGPRRRVYRLTPEGRKALERRLVDAIAVVRLSYLDHLAADETTMARALDLLAKYLPHAKVRGRTVMVVPPGYLSEVNFRWFLTQLFEVAARVLRPPGLVAIIVPDALLARDVRRPIEIGAFMEGVRVRRTGEDVSEIALEKVTAFLESQFRNVAVEPVPELSFPLLIASDP